MRQFVLRFCKNLVGSPSRAYCGSYDSNDEQRNEGVTYHQTSDSHALALPHASSLIDSASAICPQITAGIAVIPVHNARMPKTRLAIAKPFVGEGIAIGAAFDMET